MTSKKRVITVLLKLALFICFLIKVGFFSYFGQLVDASNKSITAEEYLKIERFVQSKYDKEKNNPNYKAKDYFNDLLEIREKYGNTSVIQISWLQGISNQNSTADEITAAVLEFRPKIDPGYDSREEAFGEIKKAGWSGVFNWFGGSYIYLLPWVFLLFVIWAFEGSDSKKTFFKNPFGFVISLAIYPLVIIYLVVKWFRLMERQVRITTELRRTKEKIFCVLSDDEILKIKNFAQSSLPILTWRKQLRIEGKGPQHSFVGVLLVTVLFMVVGNSLLQAAENYSLSKEVTIAQSLVKNASPPGSIFSDTNLVAEDMFLAKPYEEWGQEKLGQAYINLIVRYFSGFVMKIEHIPNSLTSTWLTNRNFQFKIRSTSNANKKEYIISNFFISFMFC